MKKLFLSALALTAVLAVSCNKEANAPEATGTTRISIRASLSEETKTAYADEKTFSWTAGDHLSLMVTNNETGQPDVIRMVTDESGTSVTFYGDLPDGWTPADFAFYPKDTGDSNFSSDLGKVVTDAGEMHLRTWGTITPDLSNPMASIPLIGKKQNDGSFAFKTATGILRFTVENIPADTYFFRLDAPEGTALNGNFSFGDDCTLYMQNVEYPWPQKYVYFAPEAEGETRDFYLPIPVGTVPAGTVVSIQSESRGNVVIATTTKDIEVIRNKVLRIPAIRVPDAPTEEWNSLGYGKFIDNFVWPFAGLADYATVEFQQSSLDANKFRIAKPYPGNNSGEWFCFDVSNPNKVASDPYFVDVEVTADGKATFKPWVRNGDYGYNYSDVLRWQDNQLPANIEIGPCYRGDEFSASGEADYSYEIGKDHNPLLIEIVFPGCEPYQAGALTGDLSDVIGSYSVSYTDYWENTGTTSITIAASDVADKGNIMITEFDGYTRGDGCSYIYGTYENGSMTFAGTKNADPFYIDANGASHTLASYDTDDVVFEVLEPGSFQSSIFIVGNRWALGDNNGFDTFWTVYKATRQ